jgi:hypothetical protein
MLAGVVSHGVGAQRERECRAAKTRSAMKTMRKSNDALSGARDDISCDSWESACVRGRTSGRNDCGSMSGSCRSARSRNSGLTSTSSGEMTSSSATGGPNQRPNGSGKLRLGLSTGTPLPPSRLGTAGAMPLYTTVHRDRNDGRRDFFAAGVVGGGSATDRSRSSGPASKPFPPPLEDGPKRDDAAAAW